jgi:hypothetical protein
MERRDRKRGEEERGREREKERKGEEERGRGKERYHVNIDICFFLWGVHPQICTARVGNPFFSLYKCPNSSIFSYHCVSFWSKYLFQNR